MNIKVESISNVEKKLFVNIPETQVTEEIERAYKLASQQARIPGFRSGKIPRAMLEKRFGPAIESQVYQDLVKNSVAHALDEQKLKAIRVVDISEPNRKDGEGFSYTASVEVKPEFEPKDYSGVTIEGTKVEIADQQIEDTIARVRDSQAVLNPKEGVTKAKKGDFVGMAVGLPGKEATDQIYEVGNENGQKELDDALLDMAIDEKRTLKLEDRQNQKPIEVEVTLKNIKEKILPAVDDNFAKSVGPFENLAELKAQIRKDLEAEATRRAKQDDLKKIMEAVVKNNPIELPKSLVESELHHLSHGVEQQMQQSGVTEFPADYSKEKMLADLRPDAERRVHEQLLIEAISEKENITVERADVDARIVESAKASRVPVAEMRSYFEKTGRLQSVAFQILAEKTLDFLLSKANIKS